ncbi:alpha/beta hydrolase [Streptomyces sp. NPDC057539]|uniref:alpha/beta hydrolase n=1 Tax=Streptomyces sp. NPDC057539 TaxID=3346159 RepID=UPI003685E6DF
MRCVQTPRHLLPRRAGTAVSVDGTQETPFALGADDLARLDAVREGLLDPSPRPIGRLDQWGPADAYDTYAETARYTEVSITTADGTVLDASLSIPRDLAPGQSCPAVVPPAPLINIGHRAYLGMFPRWALGGYAVLAYSRRGLANSTGEIHVAGPQDMADATEVVDWLCGQDGVDPGRIGFLGSSYGAGTSLPTAARDQRIKAVAGTSAWGDLFDLALRERHPPPEGIRDARAALRRGPVLAAVPRGHPEDPRQHHRRRGQGVRPATLAPALPQRVQRHRDAGPADHRLARDDLLGARRHRPVQWPDRAQVPPGPGRRPRQRRAPGPGRPPLRAHGDGLPLAGPPPRRQRRRRTRTPLRHPFGVHAQPPLRPPPPRLGELRPAPAAVPPRRRGLRAERRATDRG